MILYFKRLELLSSANQCTWLFLGSTRWRKLCALWCPGEMPVWTCALLSCGHSTGMEFTCHSGASVLPEGWELVLRWFKKNFFLTLFPKKKIIIITLFAYLFIFGCAGSLLLRRLSLAAVSRAALVVECRLGSWGTQARLLCCAWGSPGPDGTDISCLRRILYHWATRRAPTSLISLSTYKAQI